MQVYSARLADLTDRLDPTHYRPDLVEIESAVRSVGASTLDRWVARSGIGHTAAVTPHYADAGESGVPFVSGAAIKDGTLDVAGAERVRIESHTGVMAGSRLRPGMLVAVRKGDLGNAGVVPPSLAEANCSSEVLFFHLRERDRAGYLASYFNSRHGRAVFLRQQRGMMIPSISLYDVPDIVVPAPVGEVQAYIGAKVGQAEALREWARLLCREARDHFAKLHSYTSERRLGAWRQEVSDLDDERLDATFYAPPAVDLHRALTTGGATPASDYSELIKVNDFDANRPISYFEIGGVDITTGCAWPTTVAAGEAPSRAQRSVAAWDILVGTVRPERKNVGIVPPSARGQLVATSGVAVLRAKSPAHAAYLWSYLRSDAATEQLMRWNTGAAYPAIEDEVALRVLVPPSDDPEATRLGARWMLIPRLYASAKELVTAARLLVEALIERKVTEAELIDAGKDTDADRALLARLAEDGFDGAGAPLFSDLGGLADLIVEAQRAGGES